MRERGSEERFTSRPCKIGTKAGEVTQPHPVFAKAEIRIVEGGNLFEFEARINRRGGKKPGISPYCE